ncbi:MAG: hypothetical protein HY043_02475 [Verrucomicrobia bacterium]|nr:hypothetical protein [Verrucomicrobiota bacterium]
MLLVLAELFCLRQSMHAASPQLSIERVAQQTVRVTWTNSATGFVLEQTPELLANTLWTAVTTTPSLEDGEFHVSLRLDAVSQFFRLRFVPEQRPPADLVDIATPPAKGVSTLVGDATRFLYSGTNAVQLGVAPGTIEPKRAAVVRGKVKNRDGSALAGVQITVVGHLEFGSTLSRTDGKFDLAVNGGGLLTINYAKAGFCPVHRDLKVPWQDYVIAPDVVMAQLDPVVTTITLGTNSPMQMHQGSMQTDADGARHSTLLFTPGTCGSLVLANGATQNCSSISVRATEFTVGANGPSAMPAGLPPLSGYTYCVELSADEASSVGAAGVVFNQPVITYTENFLNFPIGVNVPVGIYDRAKAVWIPSPNGRVVKIISITAGQADVDTDGDNVADNGLGITTDEQRSLASAFRAGQSLWRVPVTHFSPADSNWPYTTPDDAIPPGQNGAGPDPNEPLQDPCTSAGSIIECENQVLGDSISIIGTPYTLNYRSDRVPGRVATRNIALSGPTMPASLASIGLHLFVAGRNFDYTFAASPNQQMTFAWDRLDAYGRQVMGGQTLGITIDYNYPTMYQQPGPFPSAFNQTGGTVLAANPARQQISLSDHFTATIGEGLTDARTMGLGGWTLNVHQIYDPVARVMHGGNGSRRRAGSLARILTTIDLTGKSVLFDVAAGPDGSAYIALPHGDLIVRLAPDGTQTTVAGNGTEGFSGDGGPATQAMLGDPTGIAVAADGSLYIAEESNARVRRVSPNGIISTVAGNGQTGFSGDGGPAIQASVTKAERIAVGTDSSIYFIDGARIRRVTPDGIIHTVAGNGLVGFSGDGGPATSAKLNCSALTIAPDGSFYIADFFNNRVRRVGTDGVINTVADYSSQLGRPVSVSLSPDGSLLIALEFSGGQTPQVDLLKTDGTIFTVAGGGNSPIQEGIPATQATLPSIRAIALAPDGSAFIAPGGNGSRIYRIGPALPGVEGKEYLVASADGSQLYVFDLTGRHLQTLDALTGTALFTFGYDAAGLLTQVIQKTGGTDNVTTVQHDAAGNPTAIISPYGQITKLAVDANGFLASSTNPAGEQQQFASTSDGLLTHYTDPRGKASIYTYDAQGLLFHDADPAGGAQTLARVVTTNSFTVTRTTALSRTTAHKVENFPGNVHQRTVTAPDGTQTQSTESIDAGTTHMTSSDGTISDRTFGPDPRFGMASPVLKNYTVKFPSSLQMTATSTRSAVLTNAPDPLSVDTLTATTTINGQTILNTYTAATRTIATTTPAGRAHTITLDSLGRFAQGQIGNLDPVLVSFDARSRLKSVTHGSGLNSRSVSLTYNTQGFLDTITDSIGRTARLGYDAAGRITSKTLPDGRVVSLGYDAAGNVVSVTPPGRPAYQLGYSDRNELTLFNPPAVPGSGPTTIAYDADGAITNINRAGVQTISIDYDAAGRPVALNLTSGVGPTTINTFSYDAAGRTANVIAANGVTNSYVYDGSLPLGVSWSGPVVGSVTRTYDNSLRVASQSVNGVNPITFSYDGDGLLTGAGSLAIVRDPQNGLQTGASLGIVTSSRIFNGVGEMTNYTVTATGSTIYSASYTRDGIGRVAQKLETIAGVSNTFTYAYDAVGQLTDVVKNGVTIEHYAYDANGNRTNATIGGVTGHVSYDNQDRLTQSGTATFIYNGAGDLVSRTDSGQTTTFDYDPLGNLLRVILPSNTAINYLVDGLNRRVGRKVNGNLVQAWLYDDYLRPVAELDGVGTVISRFVYAGGNVPAYLINGGASYRIVTDQLGSVRLVVNAATGAIIQHLDYDGFGNVLLDTNPGFQPFGFAGGIYDPLTKLVRFGTRDYDPQTGHWTVQDSLWFGGNDPNLYRYCHNDPVNLLDPVGLDNWDAAQGFLDQMNEEIQTAASPTLAINLLVDSLVNAAARQLGFDPGPTMRDRMFHSMPTSADRKSEDYATGELAGVCVGAVGQLATGGIGDAAEAARLARLASKAEDEITQIVRLREIAKNFPRPFAREPLQVISAGEAQQNIESFIDALF